MSTEPLVRVSICVNRKPGMLEEEFHKYWAYKHGPLVRDWLQRSGVVKYVQYHTASKHKDLGSKMFAATGRSPLHYDGMADFWVRKYEDFEAAFLDPYYQQVTQPDERGLFDMDTLAVTIGVEYIVLEDGEKVEKHSREI
ncbi:hypothetical protein M011DRAFT_471436 [Sporormia fimetaria CBS 119925]|uniref:EthD domain-containing protein n=1 Tax=Sporormia fimetaria CBS 119925 TaxID=1340428 RepID=A0A6A6V0U4_9PLEO|nr:hypothetical protein M011DRAFT_471436 [Sporormia fimetaria CBS 119925]